MKKVLFTVALVVATFVSANAQFYLGGSLGVETNSNTNPKSSFSISPEIGYYINEKVDVGLDFTFLTSKSQSDAKYSGWEIAPYARYSFCQLGKFEVIGKASVGFGGVDYVGLKSTNFGFNISPILAYSLTKKVVLFTQLNCLSLNFTSISPDGGDSSTHFSFGANANNLVNTSNFPIGFIYKF